MDKRKDMEDLLMRIREVRERVLESFDNLTEEDFGVPTGMERWTDIRRVLLRFGDHTREHANQIEGVRMQNSKPLTMPQRMLAEGEFAWGKLLAATVGLTDDDLDAVPPDGGWTIRQVLTHILKSEEGYYNAIAQARMNRESQSKP